MGVNPTDGDLPDVVVEKIRLKSLSLVGNYGFTRSDLPDIKQDLFLDVWRRLPAYDAKKGPFEKFVYWLVEKAAATIIEHRTAQKRDYRRDARSVNHVVDDPEGAQPRLTEAIPDDEGGRRLGLDRTDFTERCERAIEVRDFLSGLPDDLRELCERLLNGQSFTEVFGGIVTGRDTPSMQITDREEEREKRILAMLLQGETLMHLDNLPPYIDSPALSSLLTTSCFLGRILGFSRNVSLPNNLTIVGTGNNVQASGEIAKRVVPIMIEPTDAHPEARTDFQHPNIRAYVRHRRRVVLECLLGLVENWLAAGRPSHANRLGGFENWSEAIGGILRVNGLRAWRTNEAEWRRHADPRGCEWEGFVEAWHEAHKLEEVTVKELLELAKHVEMFPFVLAKKTPQAQGAVFGKILQRHVDAPVGQWRVRQRKARQTLYRLEAIHES